MNYNTLAVKKGFTPDEIKQEFQKNDVSADLFDISKAENRDSVINLSKVSYDALVAAGGDGTVNFTANITAGTGMPMGIIPAGTLNNFAKDNNIPPGLNDSVRLISGGITSD